MRLYRLEEEVLLRNNNNLEEPIRDWRGISYSFHLTMSYSPLKGSSYFPPEMEFHKYHYKFFFTKEGFKTVGKKIIKKARERNIKLKLVTRNIYEGKVAYQDELQVAFLEGLKDNRYF